MQPGRRSLRTRSSRAALLLLWLMVLAYAAFFSVDSIRQHDAFLTANADLGILDQTIWNTLHGRVLMRTYQGEQVSRLGDHVQLFLLPLSLVFLVWDDVRALLVLQSVVAALGALPVFWLARDELRRAGCSRRTGEVAGLALAALYLLFPPLGAANRTEFHVSLFMVPSMLLAIYHARGERHRQMWLWALAVMAVKEEMALLTLMLGLVLILSRRQRLQGLALAAVSAAWFSIATFGIVPRFVAAAHGTEQAYYFRHYASFGDTPSAIARSLLTRPARVFSVLSEPARLRYLWALLAPAGLLLPLLAPEVLIMSLPLLMANLLSDYEAMYSGVYQYSAPIVPFVLAAAAVGLGRAVRWVRAPRRDRLATALSALVLLVGLGYHRFHGETPIAKGYARPVVTAHHALFEERFVPQLPAGVVVSASNHLYPHLSHRERLHQFPMVLDAEWVMIDVVGESSMAPDDLRRAYEELVASGAWCIADAADGYLLLERQDAGAMASKVATASDSAGDGTDAYKGSGDGQAACQVDLPDAFYDFARAAGAQPEYRLEADLGPLRLLGYDILEQAYHRRVGVRFYWTRTGGAREELVGVLPVVTWLGEAGQVVGTSQEHPFVEIGWYPVERWGQGELVTTGTMVWDMGPAFRLRLEVRDEAGSPLPAQLSDTGPLTTYVMDGATWLRLPAFRWEGARPSRRVVAVDEGAPLSHSSDARMGPISLAGFEIEPGRPEPGGQLRVRMSWSRGSDLLAKDYTVFVHLLDGSGEAVSQGDCMPGYLGTLPTTHWEEGVPVLDEHILSLPADLEPGTYQVMVGWYDLQGGERLALSGGGDALELAAFRLP